LGLWILFILGIGVLVFRRVRRHARLKYWEANRPTYECGQGYSDWKHATAKSLEWSRGRRNKEVS
jgi:hypothetical protein